MEDAATERPEVLQSAVWVGALNPGNAPAVVAAAQKALRCLGDPLQPELSESLGELSLIAGDELGEVGAEQPLQRADSPLVVGAVASRDSASWSATRRKTAQKSLTHFPRSSHYHQQVHLLLED